MTSQWTPRAPGLGDVNGLEELGLALRALGERSTLAAGRVDVAAGTLSASWSGRSPEEWSAAAAAQAVTGHQTAEAMGQGAVAVMTYAQTVRDIALRASAVEIRLREAESGLGGLIPRPASGPTGVTDARRRAGLEEDIAGARAGLDWLAQQRASADALVISRLRDLVPTGWHQFRGLVDSLPARALVGGGDSRGALRRWIESLPEDDTGAAALRWALAHLSEEVYLSLLATAPALARLLMRRSDLSADPRFAAVAAATGGEGGLDDVTSVAAAFAAMLPADRALLARLHPWFVGNLDGAPSADRILANRTAVTAALETELDRERALLARLRELKTLVPDITAPETWGGYVDPALRAELALGALRLQQIRATAARYRILLTQRTTVYDQLGVARDLRGHQVLLFDPVGGRFAELIGTLAGATTSIGVLVGGTGTNITTMSHQYERALPFVAKGKGTVAMITYLGGPMPQQVLFDAVSPAYATGIAPRLRNFVAGIDRPPGATVTVLGHSYGGSLVGGAEAAGMVVDRVVHVESAGAGPGVAAVHDYAAPDTPRYSMTATGDPISLVQGAPGGGIVHGADPDLLAGVVRLPTGRVDDADPRSAPVWGLSSHSGVFDPRSTAWRNLYEVIAGIGTGSPPRAARGRA